MRRSWGLGVLAAVAGLVLAACSGGSTSPPAGSTGSTAVSSVAVSSTASLSPTLTPPPLPDAAKQPTTAGAEAFFRYFWDVYNYSFDSRETWKLSQISEDSCHFCADAIGNIADGRSKGLQFLGGKISTLAATAAPGDADKAILVNGLISQEPSEVRGSDGRQVSDAPRRDRERVDIAIKWVDGSWQILAVDTKPKT